MFKKLFALPGKIWQGRFAHGFAVDGPGMSVQKFQTGEKMIYLTLLNVVSAHTGHWPFKLFEFKLISGRFVIWHLVVAGLVIGQSMKHDVDDAGNILGPDKKYTYWAFTALNHKDKSFGEII